MIEIKAVEKDGELAEKLLRYVEECSWDDCKDHIAYMIRDWVRTIIPCQKYIHGYPVYLYQKNIEGIESVVN